MKTIEEVSDAADKFAQRYFHASGAASSSEDTSAASCDEEYSNPSNTPIEGFSASSQCLDLEQQVSGSAQQGARDTSAHSQAHRDGSGSKAGNVNAAGKRLVEVASARDVTRRVRFAADVGADCSGGGMQEPDDGEGCRKASLVDMMQVWLDYACKSLNCVSLSFDGCNWTSMPEALCLSPALNDTKQMDSMIRESIGACLCFQKFIPPK